jgi:hypothetical protein
LQDASMPGMERRAWTAFPKNFCLFGWFVRHGPDRVTAWQQTTLRLGCSQLFLLYFKAL